MQTSGETLTPEARSEQENLPRGATAAGIEVGRLLRAGALLVGGGLLAGGMRRRSVGGIAMAIAGEELIRYALTGKSLLTRALPREDGARRMVEVTSAVTVMKPVAEVYRRWREPETMRRVWEPALTVTGIEENRARWCLSGPLESRLEWDMVLVEDAPNERLRYQASPEAHMPFEATVTFRRAPADRGTEVTLRLSAAPPGAELAERTVKVLGVLPSAIEGKVLRRFKSLVETGEIPTTRRQPACRGAGRDE